MRSNSSWNALAIACTAALLLAACSRPSSDPAAEATADTIFVGGEIVTVNDAAPTAEALAVKDGRILAVGTRAALERAHVGTATRTVDLAGKVLLPAFIDAHGHYVSALTVANQVNLYAPPAGPGTDPDAIVAAIEKFRVERNIPKGELIQGYGYDENVMPAGNLLNRDHLDKGFPDNPVLAGHVSMHGGVLNSLAMKRWNFSSKTRTPPGGVIVRKPGTNEPYGLIMETAWIEVFADLPKPTLEQEASWSTAGQMLYAQTGITLAHEGATHLNELELMQRATAAGANIIDVVAHPFMLDLETIVAANPVGSWGKFANHLKIGAVKMTIDGSPQGKTAYFSTPYLTGGPGGEKNWRGELTIPQEEINRLVKQVYEWNVPLILHCNGDGAIDAFLTAYETVRAGDFSRPWNVTTIHTQFVRKDQLEKMAKYGIRPSFYTLHTYYFAEAHTANRGAAQAQYISPMRDAIDLGMHPTNHTDFYVAPLDQMFMMWSAVNRISRAGVEIGPDQRVTALEALKSMTIWAAEQYDEQANRGTLEAGKLADFVILDRNPLTVEPMAIKDIQVEETIKEGKSIYAR